MRLRRTALAVAALLAAASPALAAGTFVTRYTNDAFGNHLGQLYDMSGTGVGPFLQTYVCTDGAGNVCASGGGGGGAVTNTPASGSTLTTSQPTVGTTAAALALPGTNHREIYNPAANTASIFIGPSGVTPITGWEIPPGSSSGDLSRFSGSVYAVAASTQTVRLISY